MPSTFQAKRTPHLFRCFSIKTVVAMIDGGFKGRLEKAPIHELGKRDAVAAGIVGAHRAVHVPHDIGCLYLCDFEWYQVPVR